MMWKGGLHALGLYQVGQPSVSVTNRQAQNPEQETLPAVCIQTWKPDEETRRCPNLLNGPGCHGIDEDAFPDTPSLLSGFDTVGVSPSLAVEPPDG